MPDLDAPQQTNTPHFALQDPYAPVDPPASKMLQWGDGTSDAATNPAASTAFGHYTDEDWKTMKPCPKDPPMAPLYPQQEPLKLTPPADQPATIDGMTPEQEAAWEEQKKAEQEEKDLSTKPYEYREGMEHLKKGPPTLPFDEKPEDYETDTTQPVTPVFVP